MSPGQNFIGNINHSGIKSKNILCSKAFCLQALSAGQNPEIIIRKGNLRGFSGFKVLSLT
ncbi:MAG: hypothetical protein DWQ02_01760 [Bacteroidetes bacterium]|nr:MAG: hypothetical protein DWQ02_01760 [Bacteroidota bacterium]